MKKAYLYLLILSVVVFSACSSQPQPKPLNLNTINGDIPIYSISITVRKDIDNNDLGKLFFQKVYNEQIDNLTKLLAAKGIRADIQKFKNEFNSAPVINFEEIKITPSFIINRYYWTSQDKSNIRLTLSIPLVVMENGSMILEYSVRKDDPLYEQGYLLNNMLNIKFSK